MASIIHQAKRPGEDDKAELAALTGPSDRRESTGSRRRPGFLRTLFCCFTGSPRSRPQDQYQEANQDPEPEPETQQQTHDSSNIVSWSKKLYQNHINFLVTVGSAFFVKLISSSFAFFKASIFKSDEKLRIWKFSLFWNLAHDLNFASQILSLWNSESESLIHLGIFLTKNHTIKK